MRTGKRLVATRQRVSMILREPAGPLAGQLPRQANVLSFSLAGDGEIDLSLVAKTPGLALNLDTAHASIPLSGLKDANPLPPYVRLIHDVLIGDRSLFTRPDGLASAWKVVEPLLCKPPPVIQYAPGSWGTSPGARHGHNCDGAGTWWRPGEGDGGPSVAKRLLSAARATSEPGTPPRKPRLPCSLS